MLELEPGIRGSTWLVLEGNCQKRRPGQARKPGLWNQDLLVLLEKRKDYHDEILYPPTSGRSGEVKGLGLMNVLWLELKM